MAKRKNFPPRVEQRREDAKARAAARADRTDEEQIDLLVSRAMATAARPRA